MLKVSILHDDLLGRVAPVQITQQQSESGFKTQKLKF